MSAVLDRKKFREKFLLRLATKPVTLIPFGAGGTALIVALLAGSGLVAALGFVGMLVGGGIFLTRLLVGSEEDARIALAELEEEVERAREQSFNELERKLSEDRDTRDEKLFREMRDLARAFRVKEIWPDGLTTGVTLEIMSGVEQLFSGCIAQFERQLALVHAAMKLSGEARKRLLERRDQILEEIRESVTQLGNILSGVQGLDKARTAAPELKRLREDLRMSLEVALRVQERMRGLDDSERRDLQ